ncbi:hypothetical protein TVAG_458800 [Trichomonas vaginalis G3]|uniref:Uncharacterized protein n=1 Tax=Trichomonas vaginalis (strain ATCC PRA-98 / G3) TaxID=412133 RepID=A2E685_TRIV3|nr:hypothetical protein TVAGG3_0394240 [Trichomonas vaginalis G3]EAY11808.1 hypothetical protein TVAG_458800 [Trichomonas vaginalis G3]KAI5534214.1 hypothetical protein TVAGG3_0394240 [Trichomonas vaginalis G3]|eukprot:XP_001324031.1 hypothetical protein [Trichomonas vaginalis G3]
MTSFIDEFYDKTCQERNLPEDCLQIRNRNFNTFLLDYFKDNNIANFGESDFHAEIKNHLIINLSFNGRPNAIIVSAIYQERICGEIVTLLTVGNVKNFIEVLDIFSGNQITDFSNITIGKSVVRKYTEENDKKYNYDLFSCQGNETGKYGERLFFFFLDSDLKSLIFKMYSVYPKSKTIFPMGFIIYFFNPPKTKQKSQQKEQSSNQPSFLNRILNWIPFVNSNKPTTGYQKLKTQ